MADSTSYKLDHDFGLSDDDPMAELTRIMGFAKAPETRTEPEPADDDFSIDLEQDMLGDSVEDTVAAEMAAVPEEHFPEPVFDIAALSVPAGVAASAIGEPFAADARTAHEEPEFTALTDLPVYEEDQTAALNDALDELEFDGFEPEEVITEDALPETGPDSALEAAFEPEYESAAEPEYESAAAIADPSIEDELEMAFEQVFDDQVFDDQDMPVSPANDLGAGDDAIAAAAMDYGTAGTVEQATWAEPAPAAEPTRFFDDSGIEDELSALLGDSPAAPAGLHEVAAWDDTPAAPVHQDAPYDEMTDAAFDDAPAGYAQTDLPESSASQPLPEPAMDNAALDEDDIDISLPEFDEDAFLDQGLFEDNLLGDDGHDLHAGEVNSPVADTAVDLDNGIDDAGHDRRLINDIEAASLENQSYYQDHGEPVQAFPEASAYDGEMPDETAVPMDTGFENAVAAATAIGALPGYAGRKTRPHDFDLSQFDTVETPDTAVDATDDLDLPEVDYSADAVAVPADDDFDGMLDREIRGAAPSDGELAAEEPMDFDAYFQQELEGTGVFMENPGQALQTNIHATVNDGGIGDADHGSAAYGTAVHDDAGQFDDPGFDSDLERELGAGGFDDQQEPARKGGRGMLIAAVVAGVAVIGGIGAFALSSGNPGSTEDGALAIVRADQSPIKVKPDNPGGTTVPNQDNKVYEEVAGKRVSETPEQRTLVSRSVEPVDVAAPATRVIVPGLNDAAESVGKSEDRIDPATAIAEPGTSNEIKAVSPRRVKTFVVRPDGTLVPNEEPEVAQATPEPVPAPSPAPVEAAVAEPAPVEVAIAEPAPVAESEPEKIAETPVKAEPVVAARQVKTTVIRREIQPANNAAVPVVPSRPADQPVNIVGTTRQAQPDTPTQVAAVAPEQVASSPAWVQISSQPSRELAQASYANISRRFSSIIGGKGVSIQQAEIPGKGTFFRVNIPAGSFNEAAAMCNKLKAAGGACFPKR